MGNKIKFIRGWSDRCQELMEMFNIGGVFPFGTPAPVYYQCGTIDGICAPFPDGRLDIIAIINNSPHNGHFELFMQALEKWGRNTGKVRICSFFNERLYRKLKQRPGWYSPTNTMDALEYNHIADAGNMVADIKK